MPEAQDGAAILYLTDPMCSWCWGFAPVLDAIRRDFAGKAPVRLIVGGLRPGAKEALTPEMRDSVLHHWHEVHDMTGQDFRYDFDMPDGFRYDTEPACRAVVAVRRMAPDRVFSYFHRLQRAFYLENRDVTDTDTLAAEAAAEGLDEAAFRRLFDDPETRQQTAGDFMFSTNLGIRGFPSVVLQHGDEYRLLTIGYRSYDVLKERLEQWCAEIGV